jgi:A/G-specific adenine glycosylase
MVAKQAMSAGIQHEQREQGEESRRQRIQTRLLDWFAAHQRDLPWRQTRDPYRILVSEVMLQQTQVDRVIPYYDAWLVRFPTVSDLAAAPTADVIRRWAGLGYNRRAINLQRTARAIVDELGGEFPRDVKRLQALPGIGPYTAGAIACFAFEQDVAFLDTNMRRTLHRLLLGVDLPAPLASDRDLLARAEQLVPAGHGWRWNQALIEFGALQCTARRPACVICPLQSDCTAFPTIQSVISALPTGTRLKQEGGFSGSNRYYRGRVVDALRELDHQASATGISLKTLGPRVRDDFAEPDLPWLYDLVQGLARDGLAAVAEERAPYQVDDDQATGEVRVRLP